MRKSRSTTWLNSTAEELTHPTTALGRPAVLSWHRDARPDAWATTGDYGPGSGPGDWRRASTGLGQHRSMRKHANDLVPHFWGLVEADGTGCSGLGRPCMHDHNSTLPKRMSLRTFPPLTSTRYWGTVPEVLYSECYICPTKFVLSCRWLELAQRGTTTWPQKRLL